MRGLDAVERGILHRRATRAPTVMSVEGDPTSLAAGRLSQRGCLYIRRQTDDFTVWDITPRGRLALLCHQAVTAGMVTA